MAEQKEAGPSGIQHTVVVATINNNDIRVICNNDNFMKEFKHWYTDMTKEKIIPCQKAKYTKAIILDSARKDRIFGEYDWENIIIDYLLSLNYQLLGDGNSTKTSTTEHGRQQSKLIFLSPPVAMAAPPQYVTNQ